MQVFTISVEHDEDPQSPREDGNIGIMACAHKRYNLGDEKITDTIDQEDEAQSWDEVRDKLNKMDAIYLPLYLYDHSGITMQTIPFGDRWDSGQVGFIYTTNKQLEKMGSPLTIESDEAAIKKILQSEVESYDQYLTGDIYSFNVMRSNVCATCAHDEPIEVDTCAGFYGRDETMKAAQETIADEVIRLKLKKDGYSVFIK